MARERPHAAPDRGTRPARVLVADREPAALESLSAQIEREGVEELQARDLDALRAQLVHQPELVFLDLHLAPSSGPELIGEIRSRSPRSQIVVMTRHASVDSAVACIRAGARDYVQKPLDDRGRVARAVRSALKRDPPPADRIRDAEQVGPLAGIVARSPKMKRVLRTIRDLSRNESNVLIQAESGTGKELVARAIHDTSPRSGGPFIPVDCGALPEGLVESELFGYEAGAFTGAARSAAGLFRSADGGTLFLDEIGELPLLLQSKLLRAIQAREVRPLGASAAVAIDVRIVAATNRDLAEEVREGRFRADLFYRLRVVSMHLPSLRERPEDIRALAEHFVARGVGHSRVEGLEPEALDKLLVHRWDGNVRELENAIEAALALARGPRLAARDLRLGEPASTPGLAPRVAPPEGIPLSLGGYERACLEEALRQSDGDATAAARLLGIGRSTLYRKLARHHLNRRPS